MGSICYAGHDFWPGVHCKKSLYLVLRMLIDKRRYADLYTKVSEGITNCTVVCAGQGVDPAEEKAVTCPGQGVSPAEEKAVIRA